MSCIHSVVDVLDPTTNTWRCTIQRTGGEFCDRPGMDDMPYPICSKHALDLFRWMTAKVEHESANPIRRIESLLDWIPERVDTGAPSDEYGSVYYLLLDGLIKIGYTRDVDRRLSQYAPTAVLLATEPGDKVTEAARHRQFAQHRAARREWFHPAVDLRTFIEALPTYEAGVVT